MMLGFWPFCKMGFWGYLINVETAKILEEQNNINEAIIITWAAFFITIYYNH